MADLPGATADGGIILSRIMHYKTILPGQVMICRELVTALFISV
ncbi:hypothetical protein [Anderseniella sp. Alg231-50]